MLFQILKVHFALKNTPQGADTSKLHAISNSKSSFCFEKYPTESKHFKVACFFKF